MSEKDHFAIKLRRRQNSFFIISKATGTDAYTKKSVGEVSGLSEGDG